MTSSSLSSVGDLAHCAIEEVDPAACTNIVTWLRGEGSMNAATTSDGVTWALAHSDDGVTWGRFDADHSRWRLSNRLAPHVSPHVQKKTLQELRVFGKNSEFLLWRTDGGLRGRILRDTIPFTRSINGTDPLRPSEERRIIRGDHLNSRQEGFSHITDRTGAEQVIPIEVTAHQLQARCVRLVVRHYWQRDPMTGAVRVGASRLVSLTTETPDDKQVG